MAEPAKKPQSRYTDEMLREMLEISHKAKAIARNAGVEIKPLLDRFEDLQTPLIDAHGNMVEGEGARWGENNMPCRRGQQALRDAFLSLNEAQVHFAEWGIK